MAQSLAVCPERLRAGFAPGVFATDRALELVAGGMPFRAGYSYHNQWWMLHNADGAYEASGVHGQMIHVNPAAEMVVVKLASHPVAGAGFTHAMTLRAWAALAQAVRQ